MFTLVAFDRLEKAVESPAVLVGVSPRFPNLLPIVKSGLDYVFRRSGLSELPRLGGRTAALVAVLTLDAF